MIEIKNLTKTYKSKSGIEVNALKNITLRLPDKGFVFILGKSGSGKSTLLNLLGLLDTPTSGDIVFDGISYKEMTDNEFDKARNTLIGFVFQSYNILPDLSCGDNVLLADNLQGRENDYQKLNKILCSLDLENFASRKPSELSGGQLQRVAIARAIMKDCRLLLADEPTGALDSSNGKKIFEVLKEASKDRLVICVTHNEDLATDYSDIIIRITDGMIEKIEDKKVSKTYKYSENIIINDEGIEVLQHTHIKKKELDTIVKKIEDIKETTTNITDNTNNDLSYGKMNKPVLIDSSLSYRKSLLLALSTLKTKPFRFVLAVLLAFISFTLFGLSMVMTSYDDKKAIIESIPNNVDYISLKKSNEKLYHENIVNKLTALNDEDISNLSTSLNVKLHGVYRDILSLDFTANIYDQTKIEKNYYTQNLIGLAFLTINDLHDLGYELYGNLPTKKGEIAITKYLFEHFQAGGYNNHHNKTYILGGELTMNDLIGSYILLDEKEYKVTGIVDTKLNNSRYGYLKGEEGEADTYSYSEFRTIKLNSYLALGMISNAEMEELKASKNPNEPDIKRYGELDGKYSYEQNGKEITKEISITSVRKDLLGLDYYTIDNDKDLIIYWYDYITYLANIGVLKQIKIKEIIEGKEYNDLELLYNSFEQKDIEKYIKKYLNDILSYNITFDLSLSLFTNYINQISMTTLNSMTVSGFYFTDTAFSGVISTSIYDEVIARLGGIYDLALGKMPQEKEAIKNLVELNYQENKLEQTYVSTYNLTNQVIDTVGSLSMTINTLANLFKYVGIGFALFAILMLYNFLSTTIYYKQKDIGILRAIGARKQNVFMIFFNESLILSLINAFLASISLIIFSIVINQEIKETYNIIINVLSINVIHILVIFGLSVLASFIASFLPIRRITNMVPLEIIKD